MMVYRATAADARCIQCPCPSWIVILIGGAKRVQLNLCERCAESMRDHIEAFQRSGTGPAA